MTARSILLVDDEVDVLYSLSRILGEEDFVEVKIATSGQEALELIKITSDLAVIVSDYHMPAMRGIEFLEKVREKFPDITRNLINRCRRFRDGTGRS